MLGLRLFSRLALPIRPTPLALRTRPALPPRAHLAISRYSSDSPEDLQGSTSKEPIPAYATVPYVTSRLDKQDHQIEILGKKMEEGFRNLDRSIQETKEGFRDLDRSIHEVESKFHATLSQWLFRAATLTVGVALVSASAFLFPPLKQLLDTWDMEKKARIVEHEARAREHEARAEREQVELKKVKSKII